MPYQNIEKYDIMNESDTLQQITIMDVRYSKIRPTGIP